MLSESQVHKLRDALATSKRPLFFFHDDPDGFVSFLMFYHVIGEGKGHVVKAHPKVTAEHHLSKVAEYEPDAIFVLDLAMVDQEFLDQVKVPVYWVDHHAPQQRDRVFYANPRLVTGENIPTPALCYQVTGKDLWLATIGCIGDWYFPPFADEFRKLFPDLLPENITTVEEAYFNSPLTPMIKALSFNLKGKTSDVVISIKTMIKVESPYEVLKQTTSRGRLIWKQYAKINREYERMLESIEQGVDKKDPVLVYTYVDDKLSLTKDLANEIVYRHADKLIILGRRKSGEVKCSLRGPHVDLPKMLSAVFSEVRGTGGGHEHACGATIPEEDFSAFVDACRKWLTSHHS